MCDLLLLFEIYNRIDLFNIVYEYIDMFLFVMLSFVVERLLKMVVVLNSFDVCLSIVYSLMCYR